VNVIFICYYCSYTVMSSVNCYNNLSKWEFNYNSHNSTGFEALTLMVLKNPFFCDIILCCLAKVNQHFGGTYHHCLHGWRVNQTRSQYEAGQQIPTFTVLHSIISQKIELFDRTAICAGSHRFHWLLKLKMAHSELCIF
jgi:hypothetical protein